MVATDVEIELVDEREVPPERGLPPRGPTSRVLSSLRTRTLVAQASPSPRRHSVVRRFIWEDVGSCLARFEALTADTARPRPSRLDVGAGVLVLDNEHHDYRLGGWLTVSWSLTRYPVWLSLEPWWGERSVIGVELRSRHRLHYSTRYFDTAHDALKDLVECMGAPIGPRSVRPPQRPRVERDPGRQGGVNRRMAQAVRP